MCDLLGYRVTVGKGRGQRLNLESFTPMQYTVCNSGVYTHTHTRLRTCPSLDQLNKGAVASGLRYLNNSSVNQTAHSGEH